MYSYFRNCNHCGRSFFKINFFCKPCWEKLERHKVSFNSKIYKTPEVLVRCLYTWSAKESIVGDLIRGLKGGTPLEILELLAKDLSFMHSSKPHSIVVPVPSSKVGAKDHAYILAKCISQELNLPFWDGLEWVNKSTNQKFLNKTERFVSQMKKTKELNRKLNVILIDDLVTTGATALAARKVLKGPNPIEVWSLACRL
jgi:predicted amidophosphoribosyltransferase